MAKKRKQGKLIPQKTLSIEEVIKLVRESGIPIRVLESGIGCPITTLDKVINRRMNNGKPRDLPAKWELPLIKFIQKKKAEKEELLISTKEVFTDLNIPIKEEVVEIPDEERKRDWIAKLQEVKAEIETD